MDKKELRKTLKALRNNLTQEEVDVSSRLVAEKILACDAYQKAEHIMGYLAFGKELSVDEMLKRALADGKRVYVPEIISQTEIRAVELESFADFAYDRFGIRSVPAPVKVCNPKILDLVLVPAVAYDRAGNRMGMGAGYYDRFLPQTENAIKIGVACDALLQDELPYNEYDVSVPYLVSKSGIVKAEGKTKIKGE